MNFITFAKYACSKGDNVCVLFVCLGVYRPTQNFSLKSRCHHYRWRAAYFNLCSALMSIEQWSSEGSLVCHTYGDTGHPFILVISENPWHSHTPIAERLAVEPSRLGFEHPTFSLQGERSNLLRHRRGTCRW